MKVATFNVNGITSRLPILLKWLETSRPDVVCLQELKAPQNRFPAAVLREAGYGAVWHGQSQWNGVAILCRGAEPREVRRGLPGDPEDLHSRYIECEVRGITVACLYLPNGNPAPGPKFDYKLKWLSRLEKHSRKLLARGTPTVLAGDFNVIPTDFDVYKPERWRTDALFLPEVREAYARLLSHGWIDCIRTCHPKDRMFTFWDYWRNSFERDAGLRIDHLLISKGLKKRLKNAGVDRAPRALEKPSDHAPAWIELTER